MARVRISAPTASTRLDRDLVPAISLAVGSAIVLLAAGLRFYRLGFQALTGDEAFSMIVAQRWLVGAMDLYGSGSIESTPPLHYLLLSGWVAIAGPSEFAGRFLSLVFGVLLVTFAFRLGRSIGSSRLGFLFGLLASVNPFLVAYSQVARSYSLLACLAVLSTLAALPLLREPRNPEGRHLVCRSRIAYVFVTSLALYTHTFGALLLPFHWLLYLAWPRPRFGFGRWAVAQAAILVIAIPWWFRALILALHPAEMWLERGDTLSRLGAVLRAFLLGPSEAPVAESPPWTIVAALLVVAALAGAVPWRRSWPPASRVALAWTLGCLATAVVISLRVPLLRDRFLIVAAPGLVFSIAVAVERTRLARGLVSATMLTLALVASGAGLWSLYATVPFATARDARALLEHIAARRLPDSVFVANLPASDPFSQYYAPGLPTFFVPDAQPADRPDGAESLRHVARVSTDVWLVPFAYGVESDRFVERTMTETGFRAEDLWFGHLRLQRYALGEPSAEMRVVGTVFRDGPTRIALTEVMLAPNPATAGGVLRLALTWAPDGPTRERLTVFSHLVDESGAIQAQRDSEPLGGYSPTTSWRVGETIQDHLGVPLPKELAPRSYTLRLGLYGPDGARRLLDDGRDAFEVTVVVAR